MLRLYSEGTAIARTDRVIGVFLGISKTTLKTRNSECGINTERKSVPLPVRSPIVLFRLQKISFIAICNCRDEPASPVGLRVERITPKLELFGKATNPGLAKSG